MGLLPTSIDPGNFPASVRTARGILFDVQTCISLYSNRDENSKQENETGL